MHLLYCLAIMFISNPQVLYEFSPNSSSRDWLIVDDVVMGGRSNGQFRINEYGKGVFSGFVSLENNGGFSSVRYRCKNIKASKTGIIKIRLKGDGKKYQLRIKDQWRTPYSYVAEFKTSGEWEVVEISLNEMYPSFRGRRLNLPNFEAQTIEEVAFLIGNKRNESFELWIDKIELHL